MYITNLVESYLYTNNFLPSYLHNAKIWRIFAAPKPKTTTEYDAKNQNSSNYDFTPA